MRIGSEKEDISDYIESCDFYLHESFGKGDEPVTVKAEDATTKETKLPGQRGGEIQITYNSRGVFDIKVTIHFRY